MNSLYIALPTNTKTLSNFHLIKNEARFIINNIAIYLNKMLSVIKRVMDTIFLSATKRMVCATQLAVAVQNFINDSYGLSNTEINSKDYITRFMESYSITNMCCKSAISKKSSSKWLDSYKPLSQHSKGAISAFLCFPR